MGVAIRVSMVVALGTLAGCDRDLVGEQGRLGLSESALHLPPDKDAQQGLAVIAGSRFCPSVDGWFATPGDDASYHQEDGLDACFTTMWAGPVALAEDDACRVLPDPGSVRWSATPSGCSDRPELPADAFELHVLDPAGVEPIWLPNVDVLIEQLLLPAPGEQFPSDWRPGPGKPAQVVDGGSADLQFGLLDPRGDRGVAWSDGTPLHVPLGLLSSDQPDPDTLELRGWSSGNLAVQLELPEARYDYEVYPVPSTSAASLELVPGYSQEGGERTGSIVLRAVVRDTAGRPIYGTPVKWKVTRGYVAVDPRAFAYPDYLSVDDTCVGTPSKPEVRRATIEARLGDFHDVVDLQWTARPIQDPSTSPGSQSDSARCEGPDAPVQGCLCAVSGSRSWAPGLLVLSLLGLRRRRRRGSRAPGRRDSCG